MAEKRGLETVVGRRTTATPPRAPSSISSAEDRPQSDAEMLRRYRDVGQRLVEFGRKSGMFDIPADYELEVTVTPPVLEASIDGAAYYPAPPFKDAGVGRFYVTPTHGDPSS